MINEKEIVEKIKNALITAGSTFSQDKIDAYNKAIELETDDRARWVMEQILKNAIVAADRRSPLCDDTGIPHIILEVGEQTVITAELLGAIHEGVAEGLKELPGRPMALMGNDIERIDQSAGISPDSEDVLAAPIHIMESDITGTKLHILMLGGGPAIRAKTYRVYHRHNIDAVVDEMVEWAKEGVSLLGCSPCTLAIGVGRSHYEASTMMLEAMAQGRYDRQTEIERNITEKVNNANIGPLGLGGSTSVLATFMKVAPQRASGVRIVSIRPCCCFEPRKASVDL